jgi:drug/metabolite transporter (DMT)-like permease
VEYQILLFVLIIVVGTAGELCVARAMKDIGEIEDFRPASLVRVLAGALRLRWMQLGLLMMTVAFLALLAALSVGKVSVVIPVTALSYVVGALGGNFFLREHVSWRRCFGVLLVCLGTALVVISA